MAKSKSSNQPEQGGQGYGAYPPYYAPYYGFPYDQYGFAPPSIRQASGQMSSNGGQGQQSQQGQQGQMGQGQMGQGMGIPMMPQGQMGQGQQGAPGQNVPGMLPLQESYIENILRLNRGKVATVYMTFENNRDKTFKGVVEAAGRDHIILSDPRTGMRYILLMVYLDYITFDEEIEYQYPFGNSTSISTYPSR
ncbi:spore coat protein GerQ [Priestia filamentosa]|uniref:Spore coat protein GerQ n=1 Tax=Priestia filamentosa TaxID=1402861 RepID=A0A1X7G8D9_9BACI|nr:spore coat protein GerQ [Priestia filamentosa]AKO95212.2 spore coat protein GerQ [Priestia filamentosa]MDT3765166.1 spore coat protein GerQ [Priestia filamentosa]OXS65699.1 spore coat protein GerQ [Priestia filamentosa]RJS66047.1 spore coat protein GerQ [Priestia filamentosa]WCM15747.1 spore coat protein GerQ [Priestia filamentosa]